MLWEPADLARPRVRFARVAGAVEPPPRGRVEVAVETGGHELASAPADPDGSFRVLLDLAGLDAGAHDLGVVARDGAGATLATTRTAVRLDPVAAHAALLAPAEPVTVPPGAPSLLTVAFGEAARHEGVRPLRAAADLPAALRRLLVSDRDMAVLVEEPGALAPQALAEIAAAADRHDGPDAIYGDDIWPGASPPVDLKPAWSPELLAQLPYTGPLLAVGRAAAASALARPEPPRTLQELLLGVDPLLARVVHVCRPLFVRERWERAASREPAAVDPPPRAVRGGVSAVVCTAHRRPELLERCLRGLAGDHGGGPLEVVLVDPGGVSRDGALALCERLGLPARAVDAPAPFNFSVACNAGAAAASGGELLFVNDDVEPVAAGWLGAMRRWLARPGVGIVGARLRYPDGRLQHAGVVVGPARVDNVAAGYPGDYAGPGGRLLTARNTTAVTGACMLVERGLFETLGGFDRALAVEFNDVDLPLRAACAGARTVLAGEAELVHAEGATRGRQGDPGDGRHLRERWGALFAAGDPFMHPALDPLLDFEPTEPPAGAPRSREAPWSRAACGLAGRGRRRLEETERAWAAAGIDLGGDPGAVEGALAALQAEALAAAAARDTAREALHVIHNSRSWRATAPLRSAAARARPREEG